MSTFLALTTPTAHGSPPNIVEPTVQLIALMQQLLQQNATMLAQIDSRLSPNQHQTQSLAYQFKPQHHPFPKWDRTLPTTPIFLAQIEMYKAEAFYASIQDLKKNTDDQTAQRSHHLRHAGVASGIAKTHFLLHKRAYWCLFS